MTEGDEPSREAREDMPWGEKVVRLCDVLTEHSVPHAFGGAIAMNYHREPRSTLDVDINIFLPPERQAEITDLLNGLYSVDAAKIAADVAAAGQARSAWGATYVDLFFADTDFHFSMAERAQRQPFGEREINVLSIEDLLVCKVIFDRPKDWVDVAAVGSARAGELHVPYMTHWLTQFLGADDERLARLERAVGA